MGHYLGTYTHLHVSAAMYINYIAKRNNFNLINILYKFL